MKRVPVIFVVLLVTLFSISFFSNVSVNAERFTSPSYTIDASAIGNSIGGQQGSTNYSLVSSGGESVIGNASGGSYKLGLGYVAQLEQSLELTVSPATISIPALVPNTSQSVDVTASIITDAPGYTLSVSQDGNLTRTSGGQTISGVSGSINSPISWSEGMTKGLGFSLVSTNATPLPAKWNAGASFAAFPASDTAFYVRTGLSGGLTDTLNMRVRLDVAESQTEGFYTNIVTWIGAMTP